jgi:hypothetical protein
MLILEKKSTTSITFLFENLPMDFEFSSPPTFHSEEMPLDDLVRYYNDSIRAAVDKHATVQ